MSFEKENGRRMIEKEIREVRNRKDRRKLIMRKTKRRRNVWIN